MGKKIPKPKKVIDKGELMCFVESAYLNGPTKKRSTNVSDFTFSGGVVVFRSKTQSINVLSYTESELIDTVTASRDDRFLRYMLWKISY